jgi:hypothetical protein
MLNLYLVFSSALAVTRDTEHFLFNARALKISDTNLRKKKIQSLKASWEATPNVSNSARTTTNKGTSKTEQYPQILIK